MAETEVVPTQAPHGVGTDVALIGDGIAPAERVRQATEIANVLAPIIEERELYVAIGDGRHVKAEGWTSLLAMIGIMPREVTNFRDSEDGSYEATVELVHMASGEIVGRASAECGRADDMQGSRCWADQPSNARRSMAATRATGKAARLGFSWIMVLAGFNATPAEEMGHVQGGGSASGGKTAKSSGKRGGSSSTGGPPADWKENEKRLLTLKVEKYETKPGKRGDGSGYTRTVVTFEGGMMASGFDDNFPEQISTAHENNAKVVAVLQRKGKYLNLIEIQDLVFDAGEPVSGAEDEEFPEPGSDG